ncbi:ABC transporter ATP-binding protein [Aliiroseovarius sp.]|uniref:ABC transporter ATP-binding protein n=1 Tax=Aliiroseovarius sp. TaxID=1872442 RepID=UPI003BA85AFB
MALKIENLRVAVAGKEVVKGADLTVEPGKVAAVLGANGAGKSELVLALAGMLPSTAGRVTVDGHRIENHAPDAVRRAGIAAVPEGHRVLSSLSVEDNLRAAGSVLEAREVEEALQEAFDLFPELADRRRQLAGTLSGGQQQMVAIGHAIMARPRYLLIDEMSLGLAPLIVKRLVGAISSLVSQGTGVLLVEQFTEVALGIADTVTVMRTGDVRFSGAVETVRADPTILDQAYF